MQEGKSNPKAGQWLSPQTDQNGLSTYKLCLKLSKSSKPTPSVGLPPHEYTCGQCYINYINGLLWLQRTQWRENST